ncbi:MAG: histidine phosphatase family protein [Coriobacteriia bacterium]|nr:histidine phosphatase family protein [Coriobacteriia bacterium]
MVKHLYYLRHGQTIFNLEGVWQGRADSPLSTLGERQARAAGEHLRGMGVAFDHVFRSPLGRVAQTLEVADPSLAARAMAVDDLIEMSFGTLDGTPIEGDPRDYAMDFFATIGGERPEDVTARTCAALEELMMRPECNNVLVVGHGTTARLFCGAWATNARVELAGPLPNCALLAFAFDGATREFCLEDIWAPGIDG